MSSKRTNVELFNAVLAEVKNPDNAKDFKAFIEKYQAKLAAKNEKAKAKDNAESKEAKELIMSVLTKEPQTREEIYAKLAGKVVGKDELSVNRISSYIGKMDGVAKVETKVGKSRKMTYALA